jgi:hypothetical protein
MQTHPAHSFISRFQDPPDRRVNRTKGHDLIDLLVIAIRTLRRLALNLLKRKKSKKRGTRGKQLNAGWDQACLLPLLGVEI